MVKKHSKLKLALLITSVLVLMMLIVFLVGRSFGFFQYAKKGDVVNIISIKGLVVSVDNTTDNALNLTNVYPEYDADGLKHDPFIFTITNATGNPVDYTLKLLNDTEKQELCFVDTEETINCTQLPYQYIRYAYSINDGDYSEPVNLTSDGIVYSETILGGASTKISIKLWISSEAPNSIQGNAFFGKLVLTGEKAPEPVSFATDAWSTIVTNVKAGNVSIYAPNANGSDNQVLREVDLGELGTHYLRVANTTPCTNLETSETACGFVVEFADIISNQQMNTTETNVGGYPGSDVMFDYVTDTVYNALPLEIRSSIIDTNVISGHGYTEEENFITLNQKIYLLSRQEIFGDNNSNDTAASNTRQLDYYRLNNANLIKMYQGTPSIWWLRTASYYNNVDFTAVHDAGYAYGCSPSIAYGVSPAFRIG